MPAVAIEQGSDHRVEQPQPASRVGRKLAPTAKSDTVDAARAREPVKIEKNEDDPQAGAFEFGQGGIGICKKMAIRPDEISRRCLFETRAAVREHEPANHARAAVGQVP